VRRTVVAGPSFFNISWIEHLKRLWEDKDKGKEMMRKYKIYEEEKLC